MHSADICHHMSEEISLSISDCAPLQSLSNQTCISIVCFVYSAKFFVDSLACN